MIAQGFGVTVTDISRSRNEYYDTKYQLTNTSYNRYKTEAYYLSALQRLEFRSYSIYILRKSLGCRCCLSADGAVVWISYQMTQYICEGIKRIC